MSPIHDANAEVTGEQLRGIPEGSVEDAQKVAYAELIGEGDYLSAARLAQAYPHVIEPYESHHQWVRQHQERTQPIDNLPDCPGMRPPHPPTEQTRHPRLPSPMLNREGEEQQLTHYRPRHQLTLYEPDQDGEWWKAESISWDPGKTVRTFYVPKDIGPKPTR